METRKAAIEPARSTQAAAGEVAAPSERVGVRVTGVELFATDRVARAPERPSLTAARAPLAPQPARPSEAQLLGPARELLRLGAGQGALTRAERRLGLAPIGDPSERALAVRARAGQLVVLAHAVLDQTRRAPRRDLPAGGPELAHTFWQTLTEIGARSMPPASPEATLERLARALADGHGRAFGDGSILGVTQHDVDKLVGRARIDPVQLDAAAHLVGLPSWADRVDPETAQVIHAGAVHLARLYRGGVAIDPASLLAQPRARAEGNRLREVLVALHDTRHPTQEQVAAFARANPHLALPAAHELALDTHVRGDVTLPRNVTTLAVARASMTLLAQSSVQPPRGAPEVAPAVHVELRRLGVELAEAQAERALQTAAAQRGLALEPLHGTHEQLVEAMGDPSLTPSTVARLLGARAQNHMDIAEALTSELAWALARHAGNRDAAKHARGASERLIKEHVEQARSDVRRAAGVSGFDPAALMRRILATEMELLARVAAHSDAPREERALRGRALTALWPGLGAAVGEQGTPTATAPSALAELERAGQEERGGMLQGAVQYASALAASNDKRGVERLEHTLAALRPAWGGAELAAVTAFVTATRLQLQGDTAAANQAYARAMRGPRWLSAAATSARASLLLRGGEAGSAGERLARCDMLAELRRELRADAAATRAVGAQLVFIEASLRLSAGDAHGMERVLAELDHPPFAGDRALAARREQLLAHHRSGNLAAATKVALEVLAGESPERFLAYTIGGVIVGGAIGALAFGVGSAPAALAGGAFGAKVGLLVSGAAYATHNLVEGHQRIADAYVTGLAAPDATDAAVAAGAVALGLVAGPPVRATAASAGSVLKSGAPAVLAQARADVELMLSRSGGPIDAARREQLIANRLNARLVGTETQGVGRALAATTLVPAVLIVPLARELAAVEELGLTGAERDRARDAVWERAATNVAWMAALGGGLGLMRVGVVAAMSRVAPVSAELSQRLATFRAEARPSEVRTLGGAAIELTAESRERYVRALGPGTMEILHTPGSHVIRRGDPGAEGAFTSPLPKFMNQVGHVAIRVDDVVYNKSGKDGVRAFTLEEFTKRYPHRMTGTVYEVTPEQARALHAHYRDAMAHGERYGLFNGNCGHFVQRGLSCALAVPTGGVAGTDPALVARFPVGLRPAFRTAYARDAEHAAGLFAATAVNRSVIWGVPALASAAASHLVVETATPPAARDETGATRLPVRPATRAKPRFLAELEEPRELAAEAQRIAAQLIANERPAKIDAMIARGTGPGGEAVADRERALALAILWRLQSMPVRETLGTTVETVALTLHAEVLPTDAPSVARYLRTQ